MDVVVSLVAAKRDERRQRGHHARRELVRSAASQGVSEFDLDFATGVGRSLMHELASSCCCRERMAVVGREWRDCGWAREGARGQRSV